MNVDLSTEFGQLVARRLRDDITVWLTTVDGRGIPQPRPVWFFWDGAQFIIYSRSDKHKLRHIPERPDVALNFDSDGRGGDIIVMIGRAELAPDLPPADQVPGYVEKYLPVLTSMNWTVDRFAREFSAAIRVTPLKLRGH